MKEVWFEKQFKGMIISKQLTRTFRELPEQGKNNAYAVGEEIWLRIKDSQGNFIPEQGIVKIINFELKQLNSLTGKDFANSDADSKENLKEKLKKYYKKEYSGSEKIRVIDFDYVILSN